MDTTRDIIYRNFALNDNTVAGRIDAGDGSGKGISGCVVDQFDPDDVDVVQFSEKRAEADGMDVGNPFLGGRRIRVSGTVYGKTRGAAYDLLWQLRAIMSPVLAQREIPGDKGYLPLYFAVPTEDPNYAGVIAMQALAMPKSFRAPVDRDSHGGDDAGGMAIPWSGVFVMRDPNFEGQAPQDVAFTDTPVLVNGTATASNDRVTLTAHGLVVNDRIYFTRLTGGTGLALNTTYYVESVVDANNFTVKTTLAGAAVNITVDYTRAEVAKFQSFTGTFLNRGTYNAPLNMLFAVGAQAGTITVIAGSSNYTIAIPATTDPAFTGATGQAAGDTITKTAHGLAVGDRVYFTTLTGGTGLSLNRNYYVKTVPTADTFTVSLTNGGSTVDITVNYTVVAYSKVAYRIIRFKRNKVFTVEENGIENLRRSWLTFTQATTWPLVPAGSSTYTVTVNGTVLDPGSADGSHMWFWESYA